MKEPLKLQIIRVVLNRSTLSSLHDFTDNRRRIFRALIWLFHDIQSLVSRVIHYELVLNWHSFVRSSFGSFCQALVQVKHDVQLGFNLCSLHIQQIDSIGLNTSQMSTIIYLFCVIRMTPTSVSAGASIHFLAKYFGTYCPNTVYIYLLITIE